MNPGLADQPPRAERGTRFHRGAVLLGVLIGASGAAFVAFAGLTGLGPGAAFPLLVLWVFAAVMALRLGRAAAARWRARRRA